MNCSRKPRPEARIKTLPEEKQAEIAEMLGRTSLRAAAAALRKEGIETSYSALGRFYRWWMERRSEEDLLREAARLVKTWRQENPAITEVELRRRMEQTFMLTAMRMAETRPKEGLKLWDKVLRRIQEAGSI